MKISCLSAQSAPDAEDAYAPAQVAMTIESSRSGAAAWLRNVSALGDAGIDSQEEPRSQAGWASIAKAVGDGLGSVKARLARRKVLGFSEDTGRPTPPAKAGGRPAHTAVGKGHQIHSGMTTGHTPPGLARPAESIAEICAVLTRATPGSHILLLNDTALGPAWSLASEAAVVESPQHQNEAMAALHYLKDNVKDIPAASLLAAEGAPLRQVTADDLRRIAADAYQTRARPVYRRLGPSQSTRDDIPRMPTEVVIHWVDTLQRAAGALSDGPQKTVVTELLAAQKARWMAHDLDIDATRENLRQDSDRLRRAGLASLADIACRPVAKARGAIEGLAGQLPASAELAPVATRLHDNIYGRVFESRWVAHLVEKPPARVLAAMQRVADGMACLIDRESTTSRPKVVRKLQQQCRDNARFWSNATPDLQAFAEERNITQATSILKRLLRSVVADGYHAMTVPYLGVKLFNALATSGDRKDIDWIQQTNVNYGRNILPETGRIVGSKVKNIPEEPSAGVMLGPHPPATTKSWMTPATRPSLYVKPAMSSLPEIVKRQLNHGIPYVAGISGTTNAMLGLAAHLRDSVMPDIDVRGVLLGTVMFLAYDGDHSIHESLWTADQRDAELRLGLNLSRRKMERDITPDDLKPKNEEQWRLLDEVGGPRFQAIRRQQIQDSQFKSNYDIFMDIYQDTACGKMLVDACDHAWDDTLAYFRQHSYHNR